MRLMQILTEDKINWEQSGLISGIPEEKVFLLSTKLQEVHDLIRQKRIFGTAETLVLPAIINLFKAEEDFDAVSMAEKFIKDFESGKVEKGFVDEWVEKVK